MRVLVTGAYGFIGSHIVGALTAAGHDVVCAVRGARVDTRLPGLQAIACDMSLDTSFDTWTPRLAGIDAVVNCAGILRETQDDRFETVHVEAPVALYEACVMANVQRVIQISALGNKDDGEFIASKHRGDERLASLPIAAVILRPSVVYSAHGSYGGTSLLRAMAAMPGLIAVPAGSITPCIQPIAAEDVALAVVAALSRTLNGTEIFELVGPQAMGLSDYLQIWRRWLGLRAAHVWTIPTSFVRFVCRVGEHIGRGPFGETTRTMLEHGNLGQPDALERMHEHLGLKPRTLEQVLARTPSHTQDRWHARLYLALPALRFTIALLWLASGMVGWWLPTHTVTTIAHGGPLSVEASIVFARATASLDLLLGALCLLRWRPRWVLTAMLLMLLGYTAGIGTLWPTHWLDPLGGLMKNVPLMAAIAALLATEDKQ